MTEIPDSLVERVTMMENILIAIATGCSQEQDAVVYELLRKDLMALGDIRDHLPAFVRTCRNAGAFRSYIKKESGQYEPRREFIRAAFTPLMDRLEADVFAPGDQIASTALVAFDSKSVGVIWTKALERRTSDPEGAITIARTLLETVCKYILDESPTLVYSDKDDLPKLYALTAKALNLAPDQHTEEPIKAILGSSMNVVNGLGTLRNRLSDAHGRGSKLPIKPSARHAHLAVNVAGAVATFLVETFLEKGLVSV